MAERGKASMENYEIDLAEYVRVILDQKLLILGVFFGALVLSGALSLFLPKVYRATTTIEVGRIGSGENMVLLEEPVQLVAKTNGEVYKPQVRESLGADVLPEVFATNPEDTRLVEVRSDSQNSQLAKSFLEEMNELILSEHTEAVTSKKEVLEADIKRLERKISSLGKTKQTLEAKVNTLQKVPPSQRSVGEQFTLLDTRSELETTKQNIEDLHLRISSTKRALTDIQPTKVVESPLVEDDPVSPRPLFNLVIASVLGLFLGVLAAFSRTWWVENLSK